MIQYNYDTVQLTKTTIIKIYFLTNRNSSFQKLKCNYVY